MLQLRKDVKVGLIIGGGLLAVGLVYFAIGGTGNAPQGDAIAQGQTPGGVESVEDSLDPLPPTRTDLPPAPVTPAETAPGGLAGNPATDLPANPVNIADPILQTLPTPPVSANPPAAEPTPAPPNPELAANDPWADALHFSRFQNTTPPVISVSPDLSGNAPVADAGANEPAITAAPRGPSSPTTPGVVPGTHTVQPGETLAAISAHYLGSPRHYTEILKANPGLVPERLKVGQVIKLPAASSLPAGAAPEPAAAADATLDPTKQYRVQPGDSLHKIAERLYGDVSKWTAIYEANKRAIGDNPARLKGGQVLVLPTPPTRTASAAD
jgi:nucleoid-associated protein YgaU